MLAYISQSLANYQRLHGHKPNLLCLNNLHWQMLQQSSESQQLLDELANHHGLRVLLDASLSHPGFSFAAGKAHPGPSQD